MKTLNKIRRFLLFVIIFLGFTVGGGAVWTQAAEMTDYSYMPPFLGINTAKPNILLLLDTSTSMNLCAYLSTAGPDGYGRPTCVSETLDYDKEKAYAGYFERDQCYIYGQNRFNPEQKKIARACATNLWDGNFLNWLTMRRIDIAKLALIGGHCEGNSLNSSDNDCKSLRGQNKFTMVTRRGRTLPDGDTRYTKRASLKGVGPFTGSAGFDGIRCIDVWNGEFYISPDNTGSCGNPRSVPIDVPIVNLHGNAISGNNETDRRFDIRVALGNRTAPSGVIQEVGDRARFALMVFDKNNNGGRMQTELGEELNSMVAAIKNVVADAGTPLAESLYQAARYFAQIPPIFGSVDRGGKPPYSAPSVAKDPYCVRDKNDPLNTNECVAGVLGEWVPCCESFVLVFSDGSPSRDDDAALNLIRNMAHDKMEAFGSSTHREYDGPISHTAVGHHNVCSDYYDGMFGCLDARGKVILDAEGRAKSMFGVTHYLDDVAYWAHTTDLRPDNRGPIAGINERSTTNVNDTNNTTIGLPGMQKLNIYTFMAFANKRGPNLLKDTSRMGGFNDRNGNGIPDLVSEWDIDVNQDEPFVDGSNGRPIDGKYNDGEDYTDSNILNGKYDFSGTLTPDGLADTYFSGEDAESMRKGLLTAFNDMLQKSASGNAVSFLASSSTGEGAIYRSYFYPEVKDSITGNDMTWKGYLQGLFLDNVGDLREDSPPADGRLNLTRDKIIHTKYIPNNPENPSQGGETRAYLCTPHPETGISPMTNIPLTVENLNRICGDSIPLYGMNPIWEAGKLLAKRPSDDRKIWTWIDKNWNPNGIVVDTGEVTEFIDTKSSDLMRYLDQSDDAGSKNIINFIRGKDSALLPANFRKRETVDGTWKLGDILNSNPVNVGAPAEDIDRKYKDTTYTDFFLKYKNRRSVVYVGANDGMLHAFNAGFYHYGDNKNVNDNPSTPTVDESLIKEHGYFTTEKDGTNPLNPTHPLGKELWAFIPQELLPHLQWLSGEDYDKNHHVFYVDGSPRIVDARIFPDSDVHPNGWGTILIGSMRMGGGLIKVDLGGTPGSDDPGEDRFRSAYFAIDITDPDPDKDFGQPGKKLMWVFQDKDLGFTTSFPAIMKMGEKKWFAVFGSGPLTYAGERDVALSSNKFGPTASEYGQVYVVDLLTGALEENKKRQVGAQRYAFMGSPMAYDLASDGDGPLSYISDVVYIGRTFGTKAVVGTDTSFKWAWSGDMNRILPHERTLPSSWDYSVLYDTQKPVLVQTAVTRDKDKNPWVLFGTGRLFSAGPNSDQRDISEQAIYGIKEGGPGGCWDNLATSTAKWLGTCRSPVDLFDVTNLGDALIYKDGSAKIGTLSLQEFTRANIDSAGGWVLNLRGEGGKLEGERILTKMTVFAKIGTVPSYTPNSSTGVCLTIGNSVLYATYYESGTAYSELDNPSGPLGLKNAVYAGGTGGGTGAVISGTVRRKSGFGDDKNQATPGIASAVVLISNPSSTVAISQTSTGEILTMKMEDITKRLEGVKLFLEKGE